MTGTPEQPHVIVRETTFEQLFHRENFLWKVRWVFILWLMVWLFLPHKVELPVGLGFFMLVAAAIYNLIVTFAVTTRYRKALSLLTFFIDSLFITVGVYLSGGINSELWPLYFLSIMFASSIIKFKNEFYLWLLVSALYFIASGQAAGDPNFWSVYLTRVVTFGAVTFTSFFMSGIERDIRKRSENMADENKTLYDRVSKFNKELEDRINRETQDLAKRYKQLEMLYKVTSAVSSDIELDHLLKAVITSVREGLGFDRVGIFEIDDDRQIVKGRVGVDRSGNFEVIEDQVFNLEEEDNNFARIAAGKIDYFYTDDADSELPESHKRYMQPGIGQNAVVPMRASGKVLGMIAVDNVLSNKAITKDDLSLLRTFADQAGIALNNARLYGRERETLVRMKRLEEIKSNFLSKMSHDLRTPLTSIKESVELLLRKVFGELQPNQEKFLNIAKQNTRRLTALVTEMLDSAKMEAKELKLELGKVNLHSLVEEVIFELNPQAGEKNIALSSMVGRHLPPIHADKGKVYRVLSNLIVNAVRYTDEGGTVIVSSEEGESEITVTVKDTGIGMTPEQLNKIFEKFYQIDDPNKKKIEGVGLGLYIAKEIVEAHGGRIWAESDGPGAGSRFCFTLPKDN